MPARSLKPCNHIGCSELTRERFCGQHQQRQHEYDKHRGTAAQRGYTYRWRKARKLFLLKNPLCIMCQQENKFIPANEVDHIIPHKGDKNLFWNESNWQALCKQHHSKKTATEDGGFGNEIKL